SGQGYTYDAAGNTLTDANGQSYIYDGENKQTKASNGGGTLGEYRYDGDGKRVKKIVPATGEVTVFVYDAAGKLIGEYSTVVADAEDAKVAYLTADHLGSPRINTDRDGKVTARHDYHPYGEEIVTAQRTSHAEYTPDSLRKQFTGYERDGETGLDFAKARMFAGKLGRFSGADPLRSTMRVLMPQTLNRYTYVLNNPLRFTDPHGLYEFGSEMGGGKSDDDLRKAAKTPQEKAKAEAIIAQRDKFRDGLRDAKKLAESPNLTKGEKKALNRSLTAIGSENDGNGVQIAFADTSHSTTDGRDLRGAVVVTLSTRENSNTTAMALAIIHEGSHAADWQLFNSYASLYYWGRWPNGPSLYETEIAAYTVTSFSFKALGISPSLGKDLEAKIAKLPPDERETVRAKAIEAFMAADGGYTANGKPLTRDNPGPGFGAMRRQYYED
ncbi:MAG: hypothetical protein GX887_02845, partial [Firmicutes bacterium]|nr:hypothetical protein [Bacillota bacterium]